MKLKQAYGIGLLVLLLTSCSPQPRLVVYADPWLGGFAAAAVAAWQEEAPEVEVELRLLSSEMVAQHLHYGQPMDVFLCFRPEIMLEKGLSDVIASEVALGDLRLVLAEVLPGRLQPELGGTACTVMAASDRPLRVYANEWDRVADSSCILYSNFYRQTRDYLLRGWAGRGIVPDVLVQQYPAHLRVQEAGPVYPGAFVAFRLRHAPNAAQADAFTNFLRSEKSKSLLAAESIIP